MSLFISFEGPEGSGKTTVITALYNQLIQEGYDVVITREPGGIEISEEIRSLILNPKSHRMDNKTEALLYAAARRQHLVEKIIPALKSGKIVLCDRFIDSSLAYQGYAREIGINEVLEINDFAINNYWPNKTYFLDVDVSVGLNRVHKRDLQDRLELEGFQFHQKVYEGYQKVISMYPDRIEKIDANRSYDEVYNDIYKRVITLVPKI